MKILKKDYINKNEFIESQCEYCNEWFDVYFDDEIFVVQLENDTLLTFCDDYFCYENYIEREK